MNVDENGPIHERSNPIRDILESGDLPWGPGYDKSKRRLITPEQAAELGAHFAIPAAEGIEGEGDVYHP